MTHHIRQGRLRSIIINIGREAEIWQLTVRPILADSGHYNPSLLMSVMRRNSDNTHHTWQARLWPIPANSRHYDPSLLISLMKRNFFDRRYDPSGPTGEITLHHHEYRRRGGIQTIDSKTHPSRQWTLQPIIIDARHEAVFRQKTSYLTREVTTHPHQYPSRGRIRAIDSEDPSWPSMDIITHQLLAIRPSILFWGVF